MRSMALRPRIVHGREARLPAADDRGRDVGCGSHGLNLPADGIAVVAFVGQDDATSGQALEKQRTSFAVGDLLGGQQDPAVVGGGQRIKSVATGFESCC